MQQRTMPSLSADEHPLCVVRGLFILWLLPPGRLERAVGVSHTCKYAYLDSRHASREIFRWQLRNATNSVNSFYQPIPHMFPPLLWCIPWCFLSMRSPMNRSKTVISRNSRHKCKHALTTCTSWRSIIPHRQSRSWNVL